MNGWAFVNEPFFKVFVVLSFAYAIVRHEHMPPELERFLALLIALTFIWGGRGRPLASRPRPRVMLFGLFLLVVWGVGVLALTWLQLRGVTVPD